MGSIKYNYLAFFMFRFLSKIKSLLVLLTIFNPAFHYIFCQTIHFKQINTVDGLANNNINDIIQDKIGFIWFATDDGLNRFDGYTFKVFRNDSNDKNSISNNSVMALREDRQGKIWIGTKNGFVNRYDPVLDQFTCWKIKSKEKVEISITYILEDSKNKIWIGTYRDGIFRLDPKNGKLDHWCHNEKESFSLSNNYISCILEDYRGKIWISTYNGLNEYDPQTGDKFVRYFKYSNGYNSIRDNIIWSLTKSTADSNMIYIGTAEGLTVYRIDTKFFSQIKLPNDKNLQFSASAGSVIEEFNGEEKILWIDSYAGLIKFNMQNRQSSRFTYEQNKPTSLTSNQINRMMKDKSGVIWIATNKGVNLFSPKSLKFNTRLLRSNKLWNEKTLLGSCIRIQHS